MSTGISCSETNKRRLTINFLTDLLSRLKTKLFCIQNPEQSFNDFTVARKCRTNAGLFTFLPAKCFSTNTWLMKISTYTLRIFIAADGRKCLPCKSVTFQSGVRRNGRVQKFKEKSFFSPRIRCVTQGSLEKEFHRTRTRAPMCVPVRSHTRACSSWTDWLTDKPFPRAKFNARSSFLFYVPDYAPPASEVASPWRLHAVARRVRQKVMKKNERDVSAPSSSLTLLADRTGRVFPT